MVEFVEEVVAVDLVELVEVNMKHPVRVFLRILLLGIVRFRLKGSVLAML